jgi:periplasmic copper chaperone A
MSIRSRALLIGAAVVMGGGLLAGCGSGSEATDSTASVTVNDAWIRATDGPMTGIFGIIANTTDSDITIESASNSASAMTEIHEMVMIDGEMKMQEKAGGVVIPAGSTITLQPGGDHIMAMGMTAPVVPGDEVQVTLNLSTGQSLEFTAVAKQSAAGDEDYHSGDMDDMDDMDGDMQ